MERQELGSGDRDFERSAHKQVENGNVGPAGAQAEHAGHDADDNEQTETRQSAVGFPFDILARSGIVVDALQAESHADGVLFGYHRPFGVFGTEQQDGNADDGQSQAALDDIRIER